MPNKHLIYFFSLLLASGFKSIAQPCPSPDVKCVAVQPGPTGDITITWETPADPGGNFVQYKLFASPTLSGPYLLVADIPVYAQISYTHTGANGDNNRMYYYIETESSSVPSNTILPANDTLSSIFLDVTPLTSGIAKLTWNEIASPNIPTSTGVYNIYREYPATIWSLLTTTTSLTYNDTINICNTWLNYRIEIADATGCTSVSNVDGDQFFDVNVPVTPVIDTVSVDASGLATVSWLLSPSPDVTGYIIYQNIGGFWQAIDTVWSTSTTFYTNFISAAMSSDEQYAISAIDSCGNVSPQSNYHRTIHLSKVYNKCAQSVYLHWNYYEGWGVNSNEIYESMNGSPFALIGTNSSTDTTFTQTGLIAGNTYCYLVIARGGGKTSSSNRQCFFTSYPAVPSWTYMKSVSVASETSVTVNTYQDNSVNAKEYRIERSEDGASFTNIGTVPFSGSANVSFTDNDADTKSKIYYYRVVAVDSCGNDALTSNVSQTMLVTGEPNYELTNTITWNDYSSWLGSVGAYNIYRAVDGVWNTTPIATVPYGSGNTYTDDVAQFLDNNTGVFNYYIEAVEGGGNPYGFSETSLSNVAEVFQLPKFFVPNAFVPNGLNSIFIPVSGFIDNSDYQFSIYNRWGDKIFSTTDPNQGWDGTYSGKVCTQGVYVYLIRIKNAQGEYIDQRGSVTLIGRKKE